ncbi:hypothetical protein [Saccharothrix obliqua]|uniref:hypothetical protein n=1 Tax=Saccharothrix obliqua TaxID=2861747 RepID=UPI001C604209|nr:hypothetical protein [Saccharothrix obliqua]MBW4717891.1 hypothetical protein [Saccharothrix obliqua]
MTALEQAAAHYEEHGFAIIRNVIPPELIEEASPLDGRMRRPWGYSRSSMIATTVSTSSPL